MGETHYVVRKMFVISEQFRSSDYRDIVEEPLQLPVAALLVLHPVLQLQMHDLHPGIGNYIIQLNPHYYVPAIL